MTQPPQQRTPVGGLLLLLALVAACVVVLVVGGQLAAAWFGERADQGRSATIDTQGPASEVDDGAPVRPAGVVPDAEPARVVEVVDGDTIQVVPLDASVDLSSPQRERVRLLNIDTPEPQHPEHGRECGAGTATDRLDDLLDPPAIVWLAADVESRDRFDRALRYVWNDDGVDVQATLVEDGLAEVLVIQPNDRFAAALFALETEAQEDRLGIWGTSCLD